MKDYYKDVIIFIINSKLSSNRKLELISNLNSFFKDKSQRRVVYFIDEQGFEHFKQIVTEEENRLNK